MACKTIVFVFLILKLTSFSEISTKKYQRVKVSLLPLYFVFFLYCISFCRAVLILTAPVLVIPKINAFWHDMAPVRRGRPRNISCILLNRRVLTLLNINYIFVRLYVRIVYTVSYSDYLVHIHSKFVMLWSIWRS